MRHQHPGPVAGGQEAADALAEVMLPEGAHARREDSLWFFLNRDKPMLMLQASDGGGAGGGSRYVCGWVRGPIRVRLWSTDQPH